MVADRRVQHPDPADGVSTGRPARPRNGGVAVGYELSRPEPTPQRRRWVPEHLRWPIGFALAALAVFFLHYYASKLGADGFLQTWLPRASLNEALVWVICALGLNIVVGYAGLLDLGFVAFWAIGGYTAAWLMSTFFYQTQVHLLGSVPTNQPGIHFSFWMVLVAGAALCFVFGVIIGAPTLRLRSDYLALVTLGFGEIIPQVFRNGDNVFGFNLSNGDKSITPVDPIYSVAIEANGLSIRNLGPFDLLSKYLIFVALAALIIFISLRLREGKLGRAWLAIREDEVAASAMGVPLMRTKLAAYGIGAVAGGIGGVAYATHVNGAFAGTFRFSISITLLAMVVLGGMGNVWGVTLGALILAWVNSTGLPQFGNAFNEQFGTEINFTSYNFLIFGGALVLMMLFKREGFLPESRTRLVLREHEKTAVGQEAIEVDELDEQVERAAAGEGDDRR
ncbi:branched-chain amino acid ABC transporter permease [Micromonospora sp. NPDC005806]|uniref:branched-chain amino acid ABC transporter permease n=1 Tax=Micromonospora sp. NPDC005806 TaxID=3364234 RepID=UPI0036C5961A